MFIKETFQFIAKNKRLILIALIPAVIMGIFSSPSKIVPFLFAYTPGRLSSLGVSIWRLSPVGNPIWLLLIIPAAFLFCAATLGLAEHKMRVGNYGFHGFWQRMNFGITALIAPFAVMIAIYAAWLFLSACVLTFIEYICFAVIGSAALSITMVVIFSLALCFLLILMFSLLLLWAPVILVSGYGIADSWYYQTRLLSGKVLKFALAMAVPFAASSVLVTCFGLFLSAHFMIYVNILCYTFIIIYLIGLAMTAYFKLSDTPRKDIKKKYYM